MGLILPALLAAICFTSVAHGSEYDAEEDQLVYTGSEYDDEEVEPVYSPETGSSSPNLRVIIAVVVVIKAIIFCICWCYRRCSSSAICHCCHGNRSTKDTVIQPTPTLHPGNIEEDTFSISIPPQPAMVHDPPPKYNRNGYSKFDNPSDLESGHGQ